MTQREARCLFTRLMGVWLHWVLTEGLDDDEDIAQGEGYIALTDAADGDYDGPHRAGGAHYLGTGSDWALYRSGKLVVRGDDPQWKKFGEKWESLHALCRWGGRWGDGNHIGLSYGGRA